MKKKISKWLIWAMLAGLMVGCGQENTPNIDDGAGSYDDGTGSDDGSGDWSGEFDFGNTGATPVVLPDDFEVGGNDKPEKAPTPVLGFDDMREIYLSATPIPATPTPTEEAATPTPTVEVTATPTPTAVPLEQVDYSGKLETISISTEGLPELMYVTVNAMNVREGAGTGNKVIATLYRGDAVSPKRIALMSDGDSWMEVTFGSNKVGWVYASFFSDQYTGRPVVQTTPTPSGARVTLTPTPTPTAKITPTPKPTTGGKVTATPTPKPTDVPKATATPTPDPTSGKVTAYFGGKDITVTVKVGADKLTGVNARDAVIMGNAATALLPSDLKEIGESGYKWVIVSLQVGISDRTVGNYEDCVPDISIRASDGSKLNSSNIYYYALTLDKNNKGYGNSSTYTKTYDIVFQIPNGVTKFNMVIGDPNGSIWTYKHK